MGNLYCNGSEDSVYDCRYDDDCLTESFRWYAGSFGVKCFPIDQNCFSLSFKDKIICSNENDYVNSQVICQWILNWYLFVDLYKIDRKHIYF